MNLNPVRPQGEPALIRRAINIQDGFVQAGLLLLDTAEDNKATELIERIKKTLRLSETQKDAAWWINSGKGRNFNAELREVE